jgi:hypothetical protein
MAKQGYFYNLERGTSFTWFKFYYYILTIILNYIIYNLCTTCFLKNVYLKFQRKN